MSLSKKNYIYTGVVGHRRFTPFNHFFKYSLFMAYIDLNTVNSFLKKSWFWNVNKKALVSFHREDYHGDPKKIYLNPFVILYLKLLDWKSRDLLDY